MYGQLQAYPSRPVGYQHVNIYPAAPANTAIMPDIHLRISDAYLLRRPVDPLKIKPLSDLHSSILLDFEYEKEVMQQADVDIVARGFNSLRSDELMDSNVSVLTQMGYPLPAASVAVATIYARGQHTSQQHNAAVDYCMRYAALQEKVPKARDAVVIGALAKYHHDEAQALATVQSVV